MFEKNLALNELYDLYAPLLSEKKRTVFELYYGEDLSLFEISQELAISRQGVRDLISRTANELETYEKNLRLNQKRKKLIDLADQLKNAAVQCGDPVKESADRISEELLSLFGM